DGIGEWAVTGVQTCAVRIYGFQVGRGDGDAAGVVPVPAPGQLRQVVGQRGAAVLVEYLECLQGRPVPAAEEPDELLGGGEPPSRSEERRVGKDGRNGGKPAT